MSLLQNILSQPRNILQLFEYPSFRSEASQDVADVRIDWKETPDAHIFKAELPGVKKEDLKVEVEDGNVLRIGGERSGEQDDEKNVQKWHCMERVSVAKYFRRFRLPEDANVDEMKASMENGLLTLTVPKGKVKKPEVRSIEITIGGADKKGGKGKKDAAMCCKFWP